MRNRGRGQKKSFMDSPLQSLRLRKSFQPSADLAIAQWLAVLEDCDQGLRHKMTGGGHFENEKRRRHCYTTHTHNILILEYLDIFLPLRTAIAFLLSERN